MNYTYGFILALSIFLTFFTIYRPNYLFAICTTAAWFAMLGFHLANPPTEIVKGSPTDVMMVLAFIGLALAMPIFTMQQIKHHGGKDRRWFNGGGNVRNDCENGHAESFGGTSYSHSSDKPRGLMDLSPEEYKRYLHSKMHRRRR